MGIRSPLSVLAVGLLALGSGCLTADKKSESKKPDVTRPGVLPPPQETTRAASRGASGGVVQASAAMPANPVIASQVTTGVGPSFAKLTAQMERKVVATEMAMGWQNRIAYLPDPVRNGRMSPGIAGQMFLFGGAKLEFAQADGTLTVDLVDDSPRPAGQQAATPERWQFDKDTLRKLQTRDETFGKSYVLFLPWPAYKSDVTRVRISARYDPDNGNTLFAAPTTVTIDTTAAFGAPGQFEKSSTSTPITGTRGPGGMAMPQPGAMMPIPNASAPPPMTPIPIGGAAPMPIPQGAPQPFPIPAQPGGMPIAPAPVGAMPGANPPNPAVPDGFQPLTITLPSRQ